MRFSVKVLIQIYCFLMIQNLIQTHHMSTVDGANCFENYLQKLSFLNMEYMESLKACEQKIKKYILPIYVLEPDTEREKLELISKETCFDLNACNQRENSIEFFDCHIKTAATNMNRFVAMYLHASSLAIELNSDYTEDEKEKFRCYLAAKRKLIDNIFRAYTYHLQCLNAS